MREAGLLVPHGLLGNNPPPPAAFNTIGVLYFARDPPMVQWGQPVSAPPASTRSVSRLGDPMSETGIIQSFVESQDLSQDSQLHSQNQVRPSFFRFLLRP